MVTIEVIDRNILKYLIRNKDRPCGMFETYEFVCKNIPEFDSRENHMKNKSEFKLAFITINTRYPDSEIKRIDHNNRILLAWGDKTLIELKDGIDKKISYDEIPAVGSDSEEETSEITIKKNKVAEFNSTTLDEYLTIIRNAIEQGMTDFDPNVYLDDKWSAAHFLVVHGTVSEFKMLKNIYKVDISRRTFDGKTTLDLARNTKNIDMFEAVLDATYEHEMNILRVTAERQRDVIKRLQDMNKNLDDTMKEVRTELIDTKDELNKNLTLTLIICIVGAISFLGNAAFAYNFMM